jgi:hypothetical protein
MELNPTDAPESSDKTLLTPAFGKQGYRLSLSQALMHVHTSCSMLPIPTD